MEATTDRAIKKCERCGRRGKNAFRKLVLGQHVRGWVCSHGDTCTARTRLKARRQHRDAGSAEGTLPWIDKPVCVIGSDPEETVLVGQVLAELAGLEADVLDASRRSLARMTMRDYGCVVVTCSWRDGVGFLTDVTRRLVTMHTRGVPVVVCHTDVISPATADLIRRAAAHAISRPYDAGDLIETVARAAAGKVPRSLGWERESA